MASKQIKYGLGNTASANLNKRNVLGKFKQIQLSNDLHVQMISPQFLQSKTLKKPLKQYGIQFSKTSENFLKAQSDKTQKNAIGRDLIFQPVDQIEDMAFNLNKTQKFDYTFISIGQNNSIKPAYKKSVQDKTVNTNQQKNNAQFTFDNDKNTIFSAMIKKGSKPKKSITFADIDKQIHGVQQIEIQRKVGKAENKLKQLFNKNVTKPSNFGKAQAKKQNKKINHSQDIQEQIQQSINQYGDQQFQKFSQESGPIKESIRQEFIASGSGFIKQSIRQSIGNSSNGKNTKNQIVEQIQESMRGSDSAGKSKISQFIASYKSSGMNVRQEIHESLSGSRKSGQQVYEQIFQQYDDSLRNSRSAFKKSNNFKESDILSKSFRKKTNVVKSIKLAQQINIQNKLQISDELKKQIQMGNKFAQHLLEQKKSIIKKKADISELFKKKDQHYTIPQKNKNLMYQFKIEINKLLTNQNFQTKLRKLTSFINFGQNDSKNSINSLEDKILKNILNQIQNMKRPEKSSEQIQKLRSEYDDKLKFMLKDQQINLRVQMDKKLNQKDMQLKKMIAQLQKKFESKSFNSASAKINNYMANQQNYPIGDSRMYDVDSDYSIDSDNISWKADLWQTLPEYEKKKLYQKQTKQVTNFLTEIMISQLKEESLQRDLDISFEFPDDINSSTQKISSFPTIFSGRKSQASEDLMPKSAFNRKQFQQNISVSHPPKKQSAFPDFPRPKQKSIESVLDLNKKQSINQYSKAQGQPMIQYKKKLALQKQKVIQILSKYKSSYLRKKNDAIRKILKSLRPKDMKKCPQQNIASVIQEITILNKDQIDQNDIIYVRAYEQELTWALVNIISKNQNSKTQIVQEEMRKNYERLIILCQVKVAQHSEEVICLDLYQDDKQYKKVKNDINLMDTKCCPLQLAIRDQAVQLVQKKQQKDVKNELVENIMSILMAQFAKEFPKRKR